MLEVNTKDKSIPKEADMKKGKAKSYLDVLNARFVRVLEQLKHEKEEH